VVQTPIPKRIIQTAKHRSLSLTQRAMSANLRLFNPDYEYMFFDDEAVGAFLDREFPEYRPLFDAFPYTIQRFDFFRYLAVYRYGGFYFDLDVLLATDLDPLLESGCVFPFEGLTFSRMLRTKHGIDWQLGNYAFGAAAGHPFLKAAIDNCVRGQRDPEWVEQMMDGAPRLSRAEFSVLNTTGPGLLSRTYAENSAAAGMVTILFPDDVCDVRTWNRFGDFGIHLMEGSWRIKSSYLRRRIAQTWEVRRMRNLIAESAKLGKTRRGLGSPLMSPREA